MSAPEVRHARDVAELRTFLLGEVRENAPLGEVLDIVASRAKIEGYQPPTDRQCEERLLEEADLFYVSAAAMDAIEQAMPAVPDELVLHEWQMPSECGFAVFERPFEGTDAEGAERPVIVSALLWGCVHIYDQDDMRDFACIGISNWQRTSDAPAKQEDVAAVATAAGLTGKTLTQLPWVPLGRSDWVIGTDITTYPKVYDRIGPSIKESAAEDRRLLAALWGLCLAIPERREVLPRPVRRRADRAGVKNSGDVRVVVLPTPSYAPSDHPTGRHQKVRSWVGGDKGFWKRQPCGPGRKERRWVFIVGYWRGPVDGPIADPKTVVKHLLP